MTKARDLGDNAQNTKPKVVNAKADLIVGTGSDAADRLAVGSNGDTLVADSSATTGLRYSGGVGFTQPIINGGMDIWQRGTSFALAASTSTYTADRWKCRRNATGCTISRQTTSDTTNLPFIQYSLRAQRDSGNTATDLIQVTQSLENVNSTPFIGKTVTLSLYARAGANYSSASNGLVVNWKSGTSNDGDIIVNTFANTIVNQTITLTTAWQRFTFTGTVVATDTQIGLQIYYTPSGTAGANDWFEITGVQMDVGSTALPFRRSGGTLAGELAACQRYYYRNTDPTTASAIGTLGFADGTRYVYMSIPLPVVMRVAPTSFDFANLRVNDGVTSTNAATAIINYANPNYPEIRLDCTSGLTQFRPYRLMSQSATTGYFGFSAEL